MNTLRFALLFFTLVALTSCQAAHKEFSFKVEKQAVWELDHKALHQINLLPGGNLSMGFSVKGLQAKAYAPGISTQTKNWTSKLPFIEFSDEESSKALELGCTYFSGDGIPVYYRQKTLREIVEIYLGEPDQTQLYQTWRLGYYLVAQQGGISVLYMNQFSTPDRQQTADPFLMYNSQKVPEKEARKLLEQLE